MGRTIADLDILLIQVRADTFSATHERRCLLQSTGLDLTQLDCVNAVMVDGIEAHRLDRADAVLIGGSGSHSVLNDDPFTPWLGDIVRRLVDQGRPLFGSCWGHQFIARVLGGAVVHDPVHGEVGVHRVERLEVATGDPVFGFLPDTFTALMGHHDRVSELPAGAVELACSKDSRNQAFTIAGAPVYGTQFHAELTPEQLVERLNQFRQYMPDDREFEALKSRLRPTPEAARILPTFLELVAGLPAREPSQESSGR